MNFGLYLIRICCLKKIRFLNKIRKYPFFEGFLTIAPKPSIGLSSNLDHIRLSYNFKWFLQNILIDKFSRFTSLKVLIMVRFKDIFAKKNTIFQNFKLLKRENLSRKMFCKNHSKLYDNLIWSIVKVWAQKYWQFRPYGQKTFEKGVFSFFNQKLVFFRQKILMS